MIDVVKSASTYILGVVAGAVVAMTPETVTAYGAIAVGIITSAGAVYVNILVARRVNKNVESVVKTGEESLAEIKVVKGHVNSAAAAAEAKIEGLRKEISLLQGVAAEKKETAALLAQTAATAVKAP